MSLNGNLCFETNQVLLQPGSYFGISASTGAVPDHHQLFDFGVVSFDEASHMETIQGKDSSAETSSSKILSPVLPSLSIPDSRMRLAQCCHISQQRCNSGRMRTI